jgi:alpha-amylase/alpha-mannosidase (GH57 family)
MNRFVCIHGHFYQPPRENPWLEAVELQDSAFPYHDWNSRITAECYAQNAASRILDGEGRIAQISNNYAQISFDFGPTLLAWLELHEPDVYRAVLDADRAGQARFGGHGPALAQTYNHMILPLANRRDAETQIAWGVRDFEHRFGRRPEGMWLAETAVDVPSLELLAQAGIAFTILSPYQAKVVRALSAAEKWHEVPAGGIDPSRAYRCNLPSGRSIALFFYDGPVSRAVAFEQLLHSGERFASRLLEGFDDKRTWPQLVHIATDGESYGHHHRHGDMALAYALHHVVANDLAVLTIHGQFLAQNPPTHEVQIHERTAWSCAHGVGRWERDCGCNSGGKPGWHQKWRAPLRAALDFLRDTLNGPWETSARTLFTDPWRARNDYIDVLLDRSPRDVEAFFARHACGGGDAAGRVQRLKLLEMQRHLMLMYTSCGWFFDDISGIETVQVIQYAARAVQLAQEALGVDLESQFVERLRAAPSNAKDLGDGGAIYERRVKPSMVDLRAVGAHFALSSLFEPYGERSRIYSFDIERESHEVMEAGQTKLALGRARVTSAITGESEVLSYAAVQLGAHNLSGGVRAQMAAEGFADASRDIRAAFERSDLVDVIRQLDLHLHDQRSLRSLFRDEQRKLVGLVLRDTLESVNAACRELYQRHAGLMRFVADLGVPTPKPLAVVAEGALNDLLEQAFVAVPIDAERAGRALREAREHNVTLDATRLEYALRRTIAGIAGELAAEPDSIDRLAALQTAVALVDLLPFDVDLWRAQNVWYDVARDRLRSHHDDEWLQRFLAVGAALKMRMSP